MINAEDSDRLQPGSREFWKIAIWRRQKRARVTLRPSSYGCSPNPEQLEEISELQLECGF